MKTTTVELTKIEAAKGKTLTNGEAYSKVIYLGVNDNADNWHEIPDSEVPKEEPSDIPEKIGDGEHGN